MSTLRKLLLIASIAVIIAVSGYRPVNNSRENCEDISGTVSDVSEAGTKDAVIKLANDKETYYINRGLETKFTLDGLRKDIVGKQVVISYAKHWHFLPTSKHIAQLKLGNSILYSEF